MPRIRMLSGDVIGKIAAGEVVERPAAAIKELVENSLDAGAKHITVEVEEGGIASFRVTDDGCGIDESDIRMAFERHATSKIQTEKDLERVDTLGFRGEALASIAAVGRVTMTTRTRNRETGIRVKNEGGQILEIAEAACAPGTSIQVKELFFNVPVRKGFLKKPMTEQNAVTEHMTRLTLSHPDVSFRYVTNGKTQFFSAGDGKMESAVLAIYGGQVVRTLREVEGHQGGVLIRGYVGIGENARNNRSGENFFINGRMLRSGLLSGALEDACRERVMIGKFPICVLYLEMPYETVNVNIHPNKLEVRFRDDQQVRDAVQTIVREALQDRDAFEQPVQMPLMKPPAQEALPEVRIAREEGKPLLQRNAVVETGASVPAVSPGNPVPLQPVYRPVEERKTVELPSAFPEADRLPPLRTPQVESAPLLREKQVTAAYEPQPEESGPPSLTPDLPSPMRIFGAVFHTFILIEYADHLLLVDQHAVHERLLFDRMMKAYEQHAAGQEMLVPYIVPVSPREMNLLEENRDLLESIGLTLEPFSEFEVAVRSVPVTLGQNETADFVREAIAELENGKLPGADKKRAAILQQACKHAVKGGEALPEELLRSLVEEMIDKRVTPTCPHGRPLVVSISHTELDRKFKRIQ